MNSLALPKETTCLKMAVVFLVLATTVDARLRFGAGAVHVGGAELALAFYDPILLLLILLFWMRLCVTGDLSYGVSTITVFILFFFLSNVLSTVYAHDRFYAALECLRILKFLAMFLVIKAYLRRTQDFKSIIFSLYLAVAVQLLVSALQLLGIISLGGGEGPQSYLNETISRVSGLMGHPNMLGQILNLIFPVLLSGSLIFRKRKVLVPIFIFLIITLIMLTYSRAGIATMLFSISLYIVFVRGFKNIFILIRAILFFLPITLPIILIIVNLLIVRVESAPLTNYTSRLNLLLIAGEMFYENPLLGVGPNNFTIVMHSYDLTGISRYFPHPVHNIFALIASENGVIGLTLFLLIIWMLYKRGFSIEGKYRNLALGILISFTALFMSGMLGWSFKADSIQGLFWVLVAVLFSLPRKKVLEMNH